MDLSLKGGPLAGGTDQIDHFRFNRLNVAFPAIDRIYMTPNIEDS
jgi:hypothetical protein